MYRDLLLDQLGVNFLGPAPLDLELVHMLTTFHWNALGSTLGWWFCHNNTVSCNKKIWVEQVTVPPTPPWGMTRGGERQGGGGPSTWRAPPRVSLYCGCLLGLVRHPGTATAAAEARVKQLCGAVCCEISQRREGSTGNRRGGCLERRVLTGSHACWYLIGF